VLKSKDGQQDFFDLYIFSRMIPEDHPSVQIKKHVDNDDMFPSLSGSMGLTLRYLVVLQVKSFLNNKRDRSVWRELIAPRRMSAGITLIW
jgi:hypothetical protein